MLLFSMSSTGITVNFVNEQQGAMTTTVDEDFGFVSLLVTTTEDASFTVSPEPFSSASCKLAIIQLSG